MGKVCQLKRRPDNNLPIEPMTRLTSLFASLILVLCSACSGTDSPKAPAVGSVAAPAPSAGSATSTTDKKSAEVSVDSRKPPGAGSAVPDLKLSYPDKAAFLAGVQGARQAQAVTLDGESVWPGFGPTINYHTNKDGSISR
jgi:hypothetical protein